MSSLGKFSTSSSLQGSVTEDENESSNDEEATDTVLYQMEKKYLDDDTSDLPIDIFGVSPCKAATEQGLELLVLNHLNIRSIGDKTKFITLAKNLRDVDLAFNDITSWRMVASLLGCLPSLQLLNLSHNPLPPVLDAALPHSRLKTLVLNGVNLPIGTLRDFAAALPSLSEMYLSENTFADLELEPADPISTSVGVLFLCACGISDWSVVLAFARLFPRAYRVFLAENDLETVEAICPITGGHTSQLTSAIRSVSLTDCKINTWHAVENLRFIANLEDLRMRNIPLFDGLSSEERFHLVVARFPTLKTFNGSDIDEEKRIASERFYIRYYQTEDEKPPRYEELVGIHGILEQLVKVDLTPKKHARIIVRCDETNYKATLQLRLSSTVLCLMKQLTQITHIPVAKMRVFYYDASGFPNELRYPNQALHTLHIEDNDEIHVQSKIVTPKKTQH